MKKLMTLVLALVMVVSMASMAMAEDTTLTLSGTEAGNYIENLETMLPDDRDAKIVITYVQTDAEKLYWGVGNFGASINGAWTDAPEPISSALNANGSAEECVYEITVGDLMDAYGVSAVADMVSLKLGTWNGGKLVSVVVSTASSGDGGAGTPDGSAPTGDMTNIAILAGVAALALVAVVASKKANA